MAGGAGRRHGPAPRLGAAVSRPEGTSCAGSSSIRWLRAGGPDPRADALDIDVCGRDALPATALAGLTRPRAPHARGRPPTGAPLRAGGEDGGRRPLATRATRAATAGHEPHAPDAPRRARRRDH